MIKISYEVLSQRDRRRKWKDRLIKILLFICVIIAILPLLSVLYYVTKRAIPHLSLSFFTELPKPVGEMGGGMANAIWGSLKMISAASLIGIPWGICVGIFLSEYKTSKLARLIRFTCDLLVSIPSIVVGLFAYGLLVMPFKTFSALAGSFALMVIMVPIIARTTEEMLKLVPDHIREAGLALGLSRWRTIVFIVLRAGRTGIMTGVMLALARIGGESAPLLFTALNNSFWSRGFMEPTASLPVQIYVYAISPYENWQNLASVGAFFLVMASLFTNLTTRLLFFSGSPKR
jgi:phosphate transport system permease protein